VNNENPFSSGDLPDRFGSVADDAQLADLFGFEDTLGLRVGRRKVFNKRRTAKVDFFVSSIWLLYIHPTFSKSAVLGVAVAESLESGPTAPPGALPGVSGWIKAIFAANGALTAQKIDADPLPSLVTTIPLLLPLEGQGRDGIFYRLRMHAAVSSVIDFDNPGTGPLGPIEQCCWNLAETVARQSGEQALVDFVAEWRRYTGPDAKSRLKPVKGVDSSGAQNGSRVE
jgi:hypothetical protein